VSPPSVVTMVSAPLMPATAIHHVSSLANATPAASFFSSEVLPVTGFKR